MPFYQQLQILDKYRLQSFQVKPSNRRAFESISDIIYLEAQYSPLVLVGKSWTGKTHLLRATQRELESRGKRTLYLSGSKLKDDLTEIIRTGGSIRGRKTEEYLLTLKDFNAIFFDNIEDIKSLEISQKLLVYLLERLGELGVNTLLSITGKLKSLTVLNSYLSKEHEGILTIKIG